MSSDVINGIAIDVPIVTSHPRNIKELPASEFQAHWPKHMKPTNWKKAVRSVFILFSVVVFPVGIFLLIGKTIRNAIAKHVLRAAFFPESPDDLGPDDLCREVWDQNRAELLKNPNARRLAITTPDGIKLDCIYYKRPDLKRSDPTVIFCNGNGEGYEVFDFSDADRENANYFRFNYRGVGRSEDGPITPSHLTLDAISALQYVHEHLGVPYNKILVWGHSLGGFLGLYAAAASQDKNNAEKCVNYCADRTFSSFATVTRNLVSDSVGSYFGILMEKIVEWSGWDYSTIALWEKVGGHKWVVYNPHDRIISPESSLIRGLTDKLGISLNSMIYLKMNIYRRELDPHNRPFQLDEQKFQSKQIQTALGRITNTDATHG